ncbi:basic proline-rich protein-like [Gallus gallus]|uniref:basic proline-rich protein-like n=1 Tax=Gallus gallus TaxID=9031 RepID=UPI001F01B20B|nr:basic proline-rich protein-like [Gallus gallus]
MKTTIGGAVPVSFQPIPAPNVTSMVPQASVQPGVPGVQGQGAQLPPGAMPQTVLQLPAGAMPAAVVQLPPGAMPQTMVELPLGAMPYTGGQLPPEGVPQTVGPLPPQGVAPMVGLIPPQGLPSTVAQLPPQGAMPPTVLQLPAGAMPQTVGQLPPQGVLPMVGPLPPQEVLPAVGLIPTQVVSPTVGQLPIQGVPPTLGPLPPQGVPPTVGQLPPQEVPPIVVQLTPEGLYTIVGLLPPGERQLPLLQLLPGGMKPGMPPPNAPAHCWQHPRLAGKRQRQRQQPMGLRPGAVCRGKPPQPAGSCPLQAPGRPGPSTLLRAPAVQLRVLPGPCTLPASWEQATGPFADAVAHTQEQRHPAPTNVCPHPATAPLGCSSAALESGGEFGGCAAGGRLSAPGGCGKAGIAPLGMFLLFQQRQ